MPCQTEELQLRPLVDVFLTPDIDTVRKRLAEGGFKPGEDSWRALLDTGATGCAVSSKLVQALNLTPMRRTHVMTAAGERETSVYRVNVHPMVMEGDTHHVRHYMDVEVTEFSGSGFFDFILGMNLIRRGSLHVSGAHFTFCI